MRTVNGHVFGGCKLPPAHVLAHAPKLRAFLTSIPTQPSSVDWTAAAIAVLRDPEGNLSIGDCVIAEDAHWTAVRTATSNTLYAYSQAQTIADYSAMTGYVPGNSATDQGTDPVVALNWRVQKGYADGSKDVGWAMVDSTNRQEFSYATNEMGGVKLWLGVPDSIVSSPPNASGFVWDVSAGAPDQNNGHCIGCYGYSTQGVIISTWGMLGTLTWAALAAWCIPSQGGGAAVRVNETWVSSKTGNTPAGLNLAAMISGFNGIFGGNIPVPQPPPTTAPTCAQVEAAIDAAFANVPQNDSVMTPTTAASVAKAPLPALWPAS